MKTSTGGRGHRPSRREAVLDAGLAELTERGYTASTMASIARRTGMSTSSVYYHFPSKDTVLIELLDRAAGDLHEALETITNMASPPEVIRRLATAYTDWMLPDPRQAVLLLSTGVGGTADIEARRRRHNTALVLTVIRLLEQDRQEDIELLVSVTAVVGLFGELARAYVSGALPKADVRRATERLLIRLGRHPATPTS